MIDPIKMLCPVFFLLKFGARNFHPALLQALPVLLPRALMRKSLEL
jgi:hypothetical protein